MKRALVTGATGFIGGALASYLMGLGIEVHVIVRPESDCSRLSAGCIRHLYDDSPGSLVAILSRAQPDVVFHLASLALTDHQPSDVDRLVDSNIRFGLRLLEAMRIAGTRRIVNTGTSWQHFGTDHYLPVNLYAATKQAFEDLLAYYHSIGVLSAITLKLFDTYGPADHRRKLINLLMDAIRTQSEVGLTPGDQIIDVTHVDDVVAAFFQAARLLDENQLLLQDFFVSGERHSVRCLVRIIEEESGRHGFARFGERQYRAREVMQPVDPGDNRLPGWNPKRTFRESVCTMLAS